MRRLLLSFFVLLAGCIAHQPPDAAVSARLRATVVATGGAMGLPPGELSTGRALDDQVGLLAMRLSSERVASIDDGSLDRVVVVAAYKEALKRRAERQGTSEAPRLLVFLISQPAWTCDQTLLAAALLAQFEQEARLAAPPPGLQR